MKIQLSILFLVYLFRLANPLPIRADGDYCAPQRVINQWSCLNETINLCDTPWWNECPEGSGECYSRNSGSCPISTNYRCKINNFNADCTSDPCQTTEQVNECNEGATWKSSCTTFNSQYRGCWVLAYGCNPDCVRDASSGPYYNDYCDNACGGPTPTPGGPTNTPVPGPTNTPTPAPNNPQGHVDSVTCQAGGVRFAGWTGDKDDPLTSNSLHIYFTKDATTLGWNAGASTNWREPAVCNALDGPNCDQCASSNPAQCQHGFVHTISNLGAFNFLDNTTYTYTAWSIDISPGSNQVIATGSFTCSAPPTPVPPTPTSAPSCAVTILPNNPLPVVGGQSTSFQCWINSENNGTISEVEFFSSNDLVAPVCESAPCFSWNDPYVDDDDPYTADVSCNNAGGVDITCRAMMAGSYICSDTTNTQLVCITPTPPLVPEAPPEPPWSCSSYVYGTHWDLGTSVGATEYDVLVINSDTGERVVDEEGTTAPNFWDVDSSVFPYGNEYRGWARAIGPGGASAYSYDACTIPTPTPAPKPEIHCTLYDYGVTYWRTPVAGAINIQVVIRKSDQSEECVANFDVQEDELTWNCGEDNYGVGYEGWVTVFYEDEDGNWFGWTSDSTYCTVPLFVPIPTPTPTPGCVVDLVPANPSFVVLGQSTSFQCSVISEDNGTISQAEFTSTDDSIAPACESAPCFSWDDPYIDDGPPSFTADVSCNKAGKVNLSCKAMMEGDYLCSDSLDTDLLCATPTPLPTPTATPSCDASLSPPDPSAIYVDDTTTFWCWVDAGDHDVAQANFSSSNTGAVTVTSPDPAEPYITTATCNNAGQAKITCEADLVGRPAACSSSTNTDLECLAWSCNFSLPDLFLSVGQILDLTVINPETYGGFINCSNGGGGVEFSATDPGNAMTLLNYDSPPLPEDPYTDCEPVYKVQVHGDAAGAATVEAIAIMSDGATHCSATANITIYEAAWFQTQGGDLTSSGNLQSILPTDEVLIKDGSNADPTLTRDPGAVVYNASSYNLGAGTPSSKKWLAESLYAGLTYDYAYFERKLASGIPTTTNIGPDVSAGDWVGGEIYDEYEWFFYDASTQALEINEDIDFAARKVILFVGGGDLEINSQINLNDGTGFFMAVVDGDIIVSESIGDLPPATDPHLEGIFVANTFETKSTFPTADLQLFIRGSVIGLGKGATGTPGEDPSFDLNRDLLADNDTFPTEIIEFAPDLLFHYPKTLGIRTVEWKEVAP